MSLLDLCLDEARLDRYLTALATYGAVPEGGTFRPLYSAAWRQAREQLRVWMEEAGLCVRQDAVGNLFGRLEGGTPECILTGSHLDTVKQGGRYDGALGILAGLIAVRALREKAGRPRRTLEVIATCEEEGSRFHSRMWGSRAILGLIGPEEVDALRDAEGTAMGQAMRDAGLDPAEIPTARRRDFRAFIELHIEQGPILEAEGIPIGVVTAITGITQLSVQVSGQADHAGTTPMDLRQDPLVAAGAMVAAIARTARDLGRPAVATVGQLHVFPGAVNVVPGHVEFSVDLRHPDSAMKTELARRVEDHCRMLAAAQGVRVEFRRLADIPGIPLDSDLVALAERILEEQGTRYKRMVSGAGHDAQIFAPHAPTAMLFVPSRGGRSHSPAEFTPVEQIVLGVRALADLLYRLAYP